MNKPDIVYTMHCSCGALATKQLNDHIAATHDGFTHRVSGWTAECRACRESAHPFAQSKSFCENWARKHRALGCGA